MGVEAAGPRPQAGVGEAYLFITRHYDILNRFKKRRFRSIYVMGEEGSGKTSYALWLGYLVYGDWDRVLRYLFFRPEDVVRAFQRVLEKRERIPYVIMDDAGRWIGKWFSMQRGVKKFLAFYNMIRTVAASVVFTTPADEISKTLRDKAHVRVRVYATDPDDPEAMGYLGRKGYLGILDQLGVPWREVPYSVAVNYGHRVSATFMPYLSKAGIKVYPTH